MKASQIIQGFLIISAVLFTGCTILVEIWITLQSDYDVREALNMKRSFAFGYFIGAWFAGMVSLLAVYLLAEIAKALMERNDEEDTQE